MTSRQKLSCASHGCFVVRPHDLVASIPCHQASQCYLRSTTVKTQDRRPSLSCSRMRKIWYQLRASVLMPVLPIEFLAIPIATYTARHLAGASRPEPPIYCYLEPLQ